MKRALKLTAAAAIGLAMMGFDSAAPWDGLEGEWAYQSTDNCGGERSIDFTNDYRRDRYGDLVYLNDRPPSRRDRLATANVNNRHDYLVNVGNRVGLSSDEQTLSLLVRRPTLWPFRGFDHLSFSIADDDTLLEQGGDGDGLALMRAMGGAPVQLVRCPAAE